MQQQKKKRITSKACRRPLCAPNVQKLRTNAAALLPDLRSCMHYFLSSLQAFPSPYPYKLERQRNTAHLAKEGTLRKPLSAWKNVTFTYFLACALNLTTIFYKPINPQHPCIVEFKHPFTSKLSRNKRKIYCAIKHCPKWQSPKTMNLAVWTCHDESECSRPVKNFGGKLKEHHWNFVTIQSKQKIMQSKNRWRPNVLRMHAYMDNNALQLHKEEEWLPDHVPHFFPYILLILLFRRIVAEKRIKSSVHLKNSEPFPHITSQEGGSTRLWSTYPSSPPCKAVPFQGLPRRLQSQACLVHHSNYNETNELTIKRLAVQPRGSELRIYCPG